MKKLIFLLPFAFLFSCNTEIPREQFLEKITSDCVNKQAKQFLGDAATADQKEEFCDCFAATMAGDENEAITMKTMMAKMKNVDQFSTELEACKVNALNGVEFEEPELNIVDGDEAKLDEELHTTDDVEVDVHGEDHH